MPRVFRTFGLKINHESHPEREMKRTAVLKSQALEISQGEMVKDRVSEPEMV